MTTVGTLGEVGGPQREISPAGAEDGGEAPGLVLPEGAADELVAALVARAASGDGVKLTGQGGCCPG